MDNLLCKNIVEECLQKGCSEADASAQVGFSVSAGQEIGRSFWNKNESSIIGVRVSYEGKLGLGIVSAPQDVLSSAIAEMAIYSAKGNPVGHGLSRICLAEKLSEDDKKNSMDIPVEERVLKWLQAEERLINQAFTCRLMSLILSYEWWETTFYNSNGASGQYSNLTSCIGGVAQTNNASQAGYTFFTCNGVMLGESIKANLTENGFTERLRLSYSRLVEPLKGRVRFSSLASAQIVSSIVHAFNGESMLLQNSFLSRQDIGKRIWSPTVSLVDDPVAVGGGVKLPFDAEGVPALRKSLICDGIFVGTLCDIAAQSRLGIGTPGNARRIPPSYEIQIRPSNLILEISGECLNADVDQVVVDMGVGCEFNPWNGRVYGMATGYKTASSSNVPVNIAINIQVNRLFANVIPSSVPRWHGVVCAPAFMTEIE